jgi:hypothetical protein
MDFQGFIKFNGKFSNNDVKKPFHLPVAEK